MAAAKQTNRKPDNRSGPDPLLIFPVIMLAGIGIAMVYSASSEIALKNYSNEYYFIRRQFVYALLGLSAMLVCIVLPYRIFKPLS